MGLGNASISGISLSMIAIEKIIRYEYFLLFVIILFTCNMETLFLYFILLIW